MEPRPVSAKHSRVSYFIMSKTIVKKYEHLGLFVGAEVKVYSVSLEGAEAVIKSMNNYGNIIVQYKETQYHDDDEREPYHAQLVHPRQVELIVKEKK
jgi:uncharacterized protein YycO